MVCFTNLNTASDMQQAKESALSEAVDQLRGKDYDHLVKDIEDLQNKSKRAYIRLYEKVGENIGGHFIE